MYAISTHVDSVRHYISSLHLSEKERIILRVIFYIFLVEVFASLLFIKMWFFSNDTLVYASTVYASSAPSNTELPRPTGEFISNLENNNFSPVVIAKITRKPLTAQGYIVGLNKDNMEVFEYSNNNSAMAEAALLAKKYRKPDPNPWAKVIHIYVKDNLVIFYMGNQEEILAALAPMGQLSLVKPKPAPSGELSVSR